MTSEICNQVAQQDDFALSSAELKILVASDEKGFELHDACGFVSVCEAEASVLVECDPFTVSFHWKKGWAHGVVEHWYGVADLSEGECFLVLQDVAAVLKQDFE